MSKKKSLKKYLRKELETELEKNDWTFGGYFNNPLKEHSAKEHLIDFFIRKLI